MAGVGQGLHLGVGVLVGLVAVSQVDEHAVVAIDVGGADRLAGHGQDSLALLAGGLRRSAARPRARSPRSGRDEERDLVAALARELAHREPEPQAEELVAVDP